MFLIRSDSSDNRKAGFGFHFEKKKSGSRRAISQRSDGDPWIGFMQVLVLSEEPFRNVLTPVAGTNRDPCTEVKFVFRGETVVSVPDASI